MQTIVMGSENFCITHGMLQVDEATMQRPLKDIDHLDLALPNIPNKVLYKLQISVTLKYPVKGPCKCYKLTIGQWK
jgi:hypothetical protein